MSLAKSFFFMAWALFGLVIFSFPDKSVSVVASKDVLKIAEGRGEGSVDPLGKG